MSNAKPISYSAAVGRTVESLSKNRNQEPHEQQNSRPDSSQQYVTSKRRSPSPSHRPRTQADEEAVYVLTLLTDKRLHERMTAIRNQYFPKRINKLAAHLTLFHALPESRLESNIIPLLKEVTAKTSPFAIKADKPFRLKKGFAVSVSSRIGGTQAKQIHQVLQDEWQREDFLSEQDAGGCRLHYTLMNKVDEEVEISKAYDDLLDHWRPESGNAEGLAVWKYDRGFWRWYKSFNFGGE
ncbi:hypothetical protein M409DRAFT_37287 [Zasmidium cellare ATCC 36951]|uniref:Phosphoesterase HXTX domain-containing protein n=1 Tax=Zasmidium cellare ATCC 36951 TaxID=1080233 RepID=A0A6A6C8A1_ZASCE|nr:uncharacterized protein M409DRAFT_37287 [Zasmidium cellare ATCC 36951]KAF2163265.1 hypothetical protein M409DRAFT_37287 [Zasmidium cellare ATCC 36951]